MKDFETLYSQIENEYKEQLKPLKRKAYTAKLLRALLNIFVLLAALMIFWLVLRSGYVIVLFTVFSMIYFIIYAAFGGRLWDKLIKPVDDDYERFYSENIADKLIKERYGFSFVYDGSVYNSPMLEQIKDYNGATRLYVIKGIVSGMETEMSVISTIKSQQSHGDDGIDGVSYSALFFCTVEGAAKFDNIRLKIKSKPDNLFNRYKNRIENETDEFYKMFEVTETNGIFISQDMKNGFVDIEKELEREISVFIENSCLYLCIIGCNGLSFGVSKEKNALKSTCYCIDIILKMIDFINV